jgi:hypothetical protein
MFAVSLPGSFDSMLVSPGSLHPIASLDQTSRRIVGTHHGRTLLMLGHAAEHLASSRRFVFEETATNSDDEAIHILMSLSRDVFKEYADGFQDGADGSRVFASN